MSEQSAEIWPVDLPEPNATMAFYGNIWVRLNILNAPGDVFPGHKHQFDHVSLLATGAVRVEVEGYPPKDFQAPCMLLIRKEHGHKFTALTENTTWYCIHAMRNMNGEVLDPLMPEEFDPLCYRPIRSPEASEEGSNS